MNNPKNEHILITAYINDNNDYSPYTRHHIEAYDKAMSEDVMNILKSISPFVVEEYTREKIKYRFELIFDDIFMIEPKYKGELITPLQCLQDLSTYSIKLYAHYTARLYVSDKDTKNRILKEISSSSTDINPLEIGNIPCMVLSKFCNLKDVSNKTIEALNENTCNFGAYYVISGKEYVTTFQEIKTMNMLYTTVEKNLHSIWIQSKPLDAYTYGYYTTCSFMKDGSIGVSVYIQKKCAFMVPIVVFLRAAGLLDAHIWTFCTGCKINDDSVRYARYYELFRKSFEHTFIITRDKKKIHVKLSKLCSMDNCQDECKNIIMEMYKKSKFHKHVVGNKDKFFNVLWRKEFLPHIGGIDKLGIKILHLCHMVNKLLKIKLEDFSIPDRDDYGNKRIQNSGDIFTHLIRYTIMKIAFPEFKSKIENKLKFLRIKDIDKEKIELWMNAFSQKKVEQNMNKHIKNGTIPVGGTKTQFAKTIKYGVYRLLNRKSIVDTIMVLQQIAISVKKKGGSDDQIQLERRAVHNTQFGIIDPDDTPEGKKVGTIKNKTLLSMLTLYINPVIIEKKLETYPEIISINQTNLTSNHTKIFINGEWKYSCKFFNTIIVYRKMVMDRRGGVARQATFELVLEEKELRVWTDSGRLIRPLYIVENGKLKITEKDVRALKNNRIKWNDLIVNGLIEYIAPSESKFSGLIAINETYLDKYKINNYTHCEISPLAITSLTSSSIEMGNKIAPPRRTFRNAQVKQAMNQYVINSAHRLDTKNYILATPQKPVLTTLGGRLLKIMDYPNSYNVFFAMMSHGGKNIEDSIQINEGVVQRGFMDAYTVNTKQIKINSSSSEEFKKPDKNITKNYHQMADYSKVNENGMPRIGEIFYTGDMLMCKVKKITKSEKKSMKLHMEYEDRSVEYKGICPATVTSTSIIETTEGKIMKVRLLIYHDFNVGDKGAACSAQKGTVSEVKAIEKMPYTEDGRVPDLIMNSLAVVKRMTLSHIFCAALSNYAVKQCEYVDCTSFNNINVDTLIAYLKKHADCVGDTVMYDGITGKRIRNKIFTGYINQYRLQHIVNEKKYGIGKGRVQQKTRQPLDGRSREGGLKMGEMEKNAIFARGAMSVLKESMFDHSDGHKFYISEDTGFNCVGNKRYSVYEDKKNSTNIATVNMPWVSNMTNQLLNTMGVSVKFNLDDKAITSDKLAPDDYTIPYITIYEKTNLIGIRAKHLEECAPSRIKIDKTKKNLDPIRIAEEEYDKGKLDDYLIYRKLPGDKYAAVRVGKIRKHLTQRFKVVTGV